MAGRVGASLVPRPLFRGGGAGYEVRLVLASSRGHCFGGEWPGDEVRLVHACGASVGGELVT